MATRMKWTDTGADFVSATPRALAALRQITDPPRQPRRAPAPHVHVHLPAGYGTRTHDQSGGTVAEMPLATRTQTTAPSSVGFDQEKDCGIHSGDRFHVSDAGPNGFSLARATTSDEEGDPLVQVTGIRPPGTAGAADVQRRLAKAIAPSAVTSDRMPASLRDMQRLLDEHYRR
jgi:hypothetical protein